MTMEEVIQRHKDKPMPSITRPDLFRYKFNSIRKNPNIFASADDRHLNSNYWHSFSIVYLHLEVDTFSKEKGWYYREKKILIPKIINNILKFVFGKRLYSISRTYDCNDTYYTDYVDYKSMKEYIKEFKEDNCSDIYIIDKKIKYEGWLYKTKKEKSFEKGLMDSMIALWS